MVNPAVKTTKLSNGLGISPGAAGNILAIIGNSDGYGTNCDGYAIPVAVSRIADLRTVFGNEGTLIRSTAYAIESYGQTVLCVYVPASTAGAKVGTDSYTGSGTALATMSSAVTGVNNNYEAKILIVNGGTVGVTGITFKYSIDNGRNYSSATYSLGTNSSWTVPNSGTKNVGAGIVISFGSGTLVAGDTYTVVTDAPKLTAADIATALTNLKNSAQSFEVVELASALDTGGTIVTAMNAWVTACIAVKKPKAWIANTTIPTPSQSDSAYQASLSGYSSYTFDNNGSLCAGAARIIINNWQCIDPISYAIAPLVVSVSEEISIAELDLGALPGVTIMDDNGNPASRCHDELINQGLDALSFLTLRSWSGRGGAYVNMPRMFSPSGSDFDVIQKVRVWNLAQIAVSNFFERRLQKPVLVTSRGTIADAFAKDLEKGCGQMLSGILLAKPKASDLQVSVSRTDNLTNTTTPTITVDIGIRPLGYPVYFNISLGFSVTATQNF